MPETSDSKRFTSRTDLQAKLVLSVINTGNGRDMKPFEVDIINVSEGGIGFASENQLMIGEMFKGVLTIWTKQKFEVILKIVRSAVEEEGYSYGSSFVGLQNNDSMGIRIYQLLNEK